MVTISIIFFSYFLSQSYEKKPSPLTTMEDNFFFQYLINTNIFIYLDTRARKLRIIYCYSMLFDQSNLVKRCVGDHTWCLPTATIWFTSSGLLQSSSWGSLCQLLSFSFMHPSGNQFLSHSETTALRAFVPSFRLLIQKIRPCHADQREKLDQ